MMLVVNDLAGSSATADADMSTMILTAVSVCVSETAIVGMCVTAESARARAFERKIE